MMIYGKCANFNGKCKFPGELIAVRVFFKALRMRMDEFGGR